MTTLIALTITAALAATPALVKTTTTKTTTTSTRSTAPMSTTQTTGTAPTHGPNDAQIASIVVTANTVDVEAGKMAEAKSTNPEVKKFAQQMVADHTSVNKQAVDLVTKLKVTPQDNDTSKALKTGGDANLAALNALTGVAFDKAYVDHEVAYHQAVLDAVDHTLIPSASNAELKGLLVKVRPAFVAHLDHAKHIQSMIK